MSFYNTLRYYGDYNARVHLFPYRTEKLSLVVPMVLDFSGRVGSCRPIKKVLIHKELGLFYV